MTLIWRMIYREKIYSFRYKQLKEVTISFLYNCLASQVALVVKSLPTSAGDVRDVGSIPGPRRSLEKGMATHSSILAWRILWTEEPGGLRSIGLQRVRHNWNDSTWMHITAFQNWNYLKNPTWRVPILESIPGFIVLNNEPERSTDFHSSSICKMLGIWYGRTKLPDLKEIASKRW